MPAVELQPDYAEAWNRRAFVYYLNDDYKHALGDIRRVLALGAAPLQGPRRARPDPEESSARRRARSQAYDSLLAIYPAMPGAKEARDELRVEVEGQGI